MDQKEIQILIEKIKIFVQEREWDIYHTPKNITMALSREASELLEIFQWKTPDEKITSDELEKIEEEVGDIFTYLLMIADKLDIDVLKATQEKIEKNKIKYPVKLAKGSFKKRK